MKTVISILVTIVLAYILSGVFYTLYIYTGIPTILYGIFEDKTIIIFNKEYSLVNELSWIIQSIITFVIIFVPVRYIVSKLWV